MRGWAKDLTEARRKIGEGFRNFGSSPKDDVLHYCIFEFLCERKSTYYLTDLAKGAMETTSLAAGNLEKYDLWYPLLEKELGLVAKPDAKIISIGGKVGSFSGAERTVRPRGINPALFDHSFGVPGEGNSWTGEGVRPVQGADYAAAEWESDF